MSSENDELFDSFVTEANEALADMENDFLSIEADGADIDSDLVNKVFRGIHSMKGTAGYLGLKSIGTLAHEMENVLNLIRNRELIPTSAIVDKLLRGEDLLRTMVNDIHASNDVDVSEHARILKEAVTQETAPDPQVCDSREVDVELPTGELVFMMVPLQELVSRQKQQCDIYFIEIDFIADVESRGLTPVDFLKLVYGVGELIDSYISTAGVGGLVDDLPSELVFRMLVGSKLNTEELSEQLGIPPTNIHHLAAPDDTAWGEETPAIEAPAPTATATESAPSPTSAATTKAKPTPARQTKTPTSRRGTVTHQETSLRVSVKVLDRLMNLAGELVLGRNQLLRVVETSKSRGSDSVATRIDQVTSELQDAIMQTRMQPIGTVFGKFPRLVRDLSGKLGKQCDLVIEGKEVDLDKAIIEAIGDPLTHLIRNSVDHGVEMPDVRVDHNKNSKGTIKLRAFHEAGKVNISIEDDGAGINGAKLKQKAIEKEIMTEAEAEDLSERDAVRLIFHPGFSMAEKVTATSGRGVGMDVVKTNIEKLGGTVEISTEVGIGTTVNIKLPLTMAIIPSLIVRCGHGQFAIPQVGIRELVRIKASETARRIEKIGEAEVLRLRGTLLPLVRLSTALDATSKRLDPVSNQLLDDHRQLIADRRTPPEPEQPEDQRSDSDRRDDTAAGALNIIVVESGTLRYGLIVDGLDDSGEIVVKPLGQHLKESHCLAGATILGDGQVALILDLVGIASHMHLTAVVDETGVTTEAKDDAAARFGGEMQSVLLFTNSPDEHFAAPMPLISRIERIRSDQIECVGGQKVVQFRGTSLPLLCLEEQITAAARPDSPIVYVVVFTISGREIGLIAPQLEDIRNVPTDVDTTTFHEPGVMGSLIVEQNTTRLIDIYALVEASHPEWFADQTPVESLDGIAPRILIAEDSGFFRKQLLAMLENEGYEVVGCEDGEIAWNTLQDPEQQFDLVVTDIEMPNMDGLQLSRKIKGDPCYAHLPIIAVTSLASEEDIQRGIESGVDEYQVKLDREKVLGAVARYVKNIRQNAGTSTKPVPVGVGS